MQLLDQPCQIKNNGGEGEVLELTAEQEDLKQVTLEELIKN